MAPPPLPVTEKPPRQHPRSALATIHPAFHVVGWIFFSNLTILFNKWIIDTAGFRYPAILTCWHLVFATIATQILARTTTLLDGRKTVQMTRRVYLRAVVPIGLLYSGSLVCSNLVYLYLSVAFIQMLKASAPVAVLAVSWLLGVSTPSIGTLLNVLFIVFGVALASAGEIQFSWVGFCFQVGGILFEATRLVMIQVMLSEEGQKMDPLVGLYYYAPVCAVTNFIVAWASEFSSFRWEDLQSTGMGMLFLNALIAFLLNVTSVFLIGKTSGLVMTLTGIFKNILLVVASVLIWSTPITGLQTLGYTVALISMAYYSLGWEQIRTNALLAAEWVRVQRDTPWEDRRLSSPLMRRALFLFALLFVTLWLGSSMLSGSGNSSGGPGSVAAVAPEVSWGQAFWSFVGLGSSK